MSEDDPLENVRSARAMLSDFETADAEIRDGSLKHAIEELKNARRKVDDY